MPGMRIQVPEKINPIRELVPSTLTRLFEDGLKDIYDMELALTKIFPRMIQSVTSPGLIKALTNQLSLAEEHICRIEDLFKSIRKKASRKKCEAAETFIEEVNEIMASSEESVMCDEGIIIALRKLKYYEIESYSGLCKFMEILGSQEAVELLEITIDEEKSAHESLAQIAITSINCETIEDELNFN